MDNGPHGQASNFTWGTLNLTGQKLVLFDGNTTNPSTALYAEAVIGATFSGNTLTDITNADANPINIYYNVHLAANAYLGGLSYTIPGGGGGMLIAHAPVPPSVLLLGSGLLGLGALGWRRRRGLISSQTQEKKQRQGQLMALPFFLKTKEVIDERSLLLYLQVELAGTSSDIL